jgi:hypothetical protein
MKQAFYLPTILPYQTEITLKWQSEDNLCFYKTEKLYLLFGNSVWQIQNSATL